MGDLETSKSSGLQTASKVICDNPCFLTGLQIYTNVTNAVTVIVYDSATASTVGKVLFKGIDNAVATSPGWSGKSWVFPVEGLKMKRILTYILISLFILLPSAFAFEISTSSGEKTADSVVYSKKAYITSVLVVTDGTNDARVIIHDNASSAAGKVMLEQTVVGADNYGGRNWSFPVLCRDGIYADVNGTGASYIIEYIPAR